MSYYEVVEKLDLDKLFSLVISGKVELPFLIDQPKEPYGFPPAMIPLWLEDIDFVGFWHHWFVKNRTNTIILQMPELDYLIMERAKTIQQLIIIYLYERLCSLGRLDSIAYSCCKSINFLHTEDLLTIYNKNGPGLENLLALKVFNENPPRSCTMFKNLDLTEEDLKSYTSLDFDENEKLHFETIAPEWFKPNDIERVFYKFLQRKDYKSAWMTLNSSGWEFLQAKMAILKLSKAVECSRFEPFAKSWTALPHEEFGSY